VHKQLFSAVLATAVVAGALAPVAALAQPRQGAANQPGNAGTLRCAPRGTVPTGSLKPCPLPRQTPPDVPPTNGFLPLLGPMLVAGGLGGAIGSGVQGDPASP
jgi:hypothetical protein